VPGNGPAGAWSHPLPMLELVRATLVRAMVPLSAVQEDALVRAGERYAAEDAARRAAYGDDTLLLRRIVDEATAADRLVADVEAVLNAEQRDVLRPPPVRGLVGLDSFGAAVVFEERLDRMRFRDDADLVERFVAEHVEQLGLDDADAATLRALAPAWAQALPASYRATPAPHRRAEVERAADVHAAALAQVALYEAFLRQAALTDGQRNRLLEAEDVLVPVRKD
jgi:hypothetical protein